MMTCITHCSDIPFMPYPTVLTHYLLEDIPNEVFFVPAMKTSLNYLARRGRMILLQVTCECRRKKALFAVESVMKLRRTTYPSYVHPAQADCNKSMLVGEHKFSASYTMAITEEHGVSGPILIAQLTSVNLRLRYLIRCLVSLTTASQTCRRASPRYHPSPLCQGEGHDRGPVSPRKTKQFADEQ